jgi:hypothetical protein
MGCREMKGKMTARTRSKHESLGERKGKMKARTRSRRV